MLCHYKDIIEGMGKPQWFDRYGCPRYCDIHPSNSSNIYADYVAFANIECQQCGHEFVVEFTSDSMSTIRNPGYSLRDDKEPYYGDPPNINCCSAGPTMSSINRGFHSRWERERGTNFEWRKLDV